MELKDLTEEQAIEIAKLSYSWPDTMDNIKCVYQPYDTSWLDDAREYCLITFDAITYGHTVDTYRLYIYPTLNLSLDVIRTNPKNVTKAQQKDFKRIGVVFLGQFPMRNQHEIHKKFIEWNIIPVPSRHHEL